MFRDLAFAKLLFNLLKYLKTELGSLTYNTNNNICPANFKQNHFTNSIKILHFVVKYNLFTVNKWIFTILKSILYKNT